MREEYHIELPAEVDGETAAAYLEEAAQKVADEEALYRLNVTNFRNEEGAYEVEINSVLGFLTAELDADETYDSIEVVDDNTMKYQEPELMEKFGADLEQYVDEIASAEQ